MLRDRNATIALGGSLSALFLVQTALAQPAQPAQQPVQSGGEGPALEEIVVTAQKRSENIQNVPLSVTAVSGETFKKLALTQFTDLALLTPGLELADNAPFFTPTLRGISYDELSEDNFPTVDIYWNEMVLNIPSPAFRSLFDIQDIEVLKGPQGSLRGRTSPAGAITITTHTPDMDQYNGYVFQEFSDQGLVHSEAAVNIPVIEDKLAIRIAGVYDFNNDNGAKDLTTGKDERSQTRALRESIRWTPTDDLEVNLTHQDLTDRYNSMQLIAGGPGPTGGPVISLNQRADLAASAADYIERQDLTVLTAKYQLPYNLELDYTGGYQYILDGINRDNDPTNTIHGFFPYQIFPTVVGELTQEVRVQSVGNDFWNYMFGTYYDYAKTSNHLVQNQALTGFKAGPPQQPSLVGLVNGSFPGTIQDFAFFTFQKLQVTDSDLIEAAARWGETNLYRQGHISIYIPQFHLTLPQPDEIARQDVRIGAHYVTGSVNYTHHFDKNLMAYAGWSHAFRPGTSIVGASNVGINSGLANVGNETSDEFEIGTKDSFFEHRLSVNGDIFHQKFHGYIGSHPQVPWREGSSGPPSTSTPTIPEGGFNGDADINGAEFEINGLITPDWQVTLDGSVVDARYDNAREPCEDYLGTGHQNVAPPGKTPRIQGTGQVSYCIVNTPIADAPPLSLTLTSEYTHPVFWDLEGFVRNVVAFTSTYFEPDLQQTADANFQVNLYLGVRDPDKHWEGQMFIKNLFERLNQKLSLQDIIEGNNLYDSGYRGLVENQPREIGFSLRYNFGG